MYRGSSVCVVVPAFNEESQISRVVETMPDYVDHIVIVDDKSTDRTVEVVERLGREDSRVVLLEHDRNQGVGGAIASGYLWARDNDVDLATVMAGDAQMDPADLPNLLDPVVDGGADYSKGNRLVTGEAFNTIPKVRYFGNAVLSLFTKIASGYWNVADSQTGYTVINRKGLEAIDWRTMFKRYGQPNDLLVKLNVQGLRVVDIPIRPVYNVGEKSGIKIGKVVFSIGWLLLRLFFWRLKEKYIIRDFHPLVFFYAFGFGMMTVAAVFAIRLVVLWIEAGQAPELTALGLVFSFTLACQSMFFAMWFDYEDNKHLRGTANSKS